MASKTLLRTGASLLSRAVSSGLSTKAPIANGGNLLSRNLALLQNGAVFANHLTSEELFSRYPCEIGNGGKKFEDECLEELERVSVTNKAFIHPCGQPSLEFFLPDGDDSSNEEMILLPKRTFQPSTIRRKRTHGFFARTRHSEK
ncbi:hypothetical protein V2J09_004548 [Rumex salicifolius]